MAAVDDIDSAESRPYNNPAVFNNGDIIGLTNMNPMQRNQHFKPASKRIMTIKNNNSTILTPVK